MQTFCVCSGINFSLDFLFTVQGEGDGRDRKCTVLQYRGRGTEGTENVLFYSTGGGGWKGQKMYCLWKKSYYLNIKGNARKFKELYDVKLKSIDLISCFCIIFKAL
jgi:hypothetical protein